MKFWSQNNVGDRHAEGHAARQRDHRWAELSCNNNGSHRVPIKKAIIAKYETIIATTNQTRRAPDLIAVTRNATTSVVLCKLGLYV